MVTQFPYMCRCLEPGPPLKRPSARGPRSQPRRPIPAVNSPGWEKGLLDRQFKLSKAGRGPEIVRRDQFQFLIVNSLQN